MKYVSPFQNYLAQLHTLIYFFGEVAYSSDEEIWMHKSKRGDWGKWTFHKVPTYNVYF